MPTPEHPAEAVARRRAARLAVFLELYQEYERRGAASRPAIRRLIGAFDDSDPRLVRVAIECLARVGDEATIAPLTELRTRLQKLSREGRAPEGNDTLLSRIEFAQGRIRARQWELQ
jgi:HEAT repeat protein